MSAKINCDCGFLYCHCDLLGCRCGHPTHDYKACSQKLINQATQQETNCPCPGVRNHHEIRKCARCQDGCDHCQDGYQNIIVDICPDCCGKGVGCACQTCLSDNGLPGKKDPGTCVLCHGDGEWLDLANLGENEAEEDE